jgi:1,2-diacylglycerol 3-beta-glucosyltransferase
MIPTASFLVLLLGMMLVYKHILALVGLMGVEEARQAGWPPFHRFAVVIPAYNEEYSIQSVVDSCGSLSYPAEQFSVYVIADNCTDQTAERAMLAGARVLERSDLTARGKGHALAWAFQHILPMGFDALVVIDADCKIEPHALRVFNRALGAGDQVLQCRYVVANPDESAMSYASAVGNVIENDLFYEPKSRHGLAVLLRGTGMVLHREILERFPWRAFSVTEDLQYALGLIRGGVRIKFLPDVRVFSSFPATPGQLGTQRRRWAGGVAALGKAEALGLIVDGLRNREYRLLDAGWTLLVLSRPLLLTLTTATLVLALSAWWIAPGRGTGAIFIIAMIEAFLLMAYFAIGIYRLGLNSHRLRLLAQAPAVVARMIWASLHGVFGSEDNTWRRTPRADEAHSSIH